MSETIGSALAPHRAQREPQIDAPEAGPAAQQAEERGGGLADELEHVARAAQRGKRDDADARQERGRARARRATSCSGTARASASKRWIALRQAVGHEDERPAAGQLVELGQPGEEAAVPAGQLRRVEGEPRDARIRPEPAAQLGEIGSLPAELHSPARRTHRVASLANDSAIAGGAGGEVLHGDHTGSAPAAVARSCCAAAAARAHDAGGAHRGQQKPPSTVCACRRGRGAATSPRPNLWLNDVLALAILRGSIARLHITGPGGLRCWRMDTSGKSCGGVGLSPGIAIGPVYFIDTELASTAQRSIATDDVGREVRRFRSAVTETRKQITSVKGRVERAASEQEARIFSVHLLILDDPAFADEVDELIKRDRINAEAAVARVAKTFEDQLLSLNDPIHRDRAFDIRDVTTRILRILLEREQETLFTNREPFVICARELLPSMTVSLDKDKLLGMITEVGDVLARGHPGAHVRHSGGERHREHRAVRAAGNAWWWMAASAG
ncbi:MAG: phosphoenolpyruvate-utilizing N-terminal domain-containing protein [Planctomycetota bacterium]